jgi:hypothetical protein
VPGLQHGGDASSADLGVVVGAGRQRRERFGIGAAGEQRLDRIGPADVSVAAKRSKNARVTALSRGGKSNCARRCKATASR